MPSLHQRVFTVVSPYFRERRFARFRELLQPEPFDTILDIGGTTAMWQRTPVAVGNVHVLNLEPRWIQRNGDTRATVAPVVGNALSLPVADGAYDIVFSNSVIEHVGTRENQLRFAEEARRAGKKLWVQTPAREFFFEPHYLTPFVHYLPKAAQRRLLRYVSVWGWLNRPSPAHIADIVDEIRLLTHAEMKVLFPDCEIVRETVGGMTKSYIAYHA